MTSETSLTTNDKPRRGPRQVGYAVAARATVWALEAPERLRTLNKRLSEEHGFNGEIAAGLGLGGLAVIVTTGADGPIGNVVNDVGTSVINGLRLQDA
jgi:hypothetical protein